MQQKQTALRRSLTALLAVALIVIAMATLLTACNPTDKNNQSENKIYNTCGGIAKLFTESEYEALMGYLLTNNISIVYYSDAEMSTLTLYFSEDYYVSMLMGKYAEQ